MTKMIKVMVVSCFLLAITPSLAEAGSKMHQHSKKYRNVEKSRIKAGLEVEALLSLTVKAFG